jgi:hypothetical protein
MGVKRLLNGAALPHFFPFVLDDDVSENLSLGFVSILSLLNAITIFDDLCNQMQGDGVNLNS